mgnify:CR=1 FL=1|tara:strand:+ start:109 stop:411 length:303 start_codon:yes stop_codon:yes gene_type:complete
MSKQKDYVAEIMQKWYDEMDKHNVGVQPKCVTILGTIMAKYKITDAEPRDVWAEALTKRGGEFMDWYQSLTEEEQGIYHDKLTNKQDTKRDHVEKQLLKG